MGSASRYLGLHCGDSKRDFALNRQAVTGFCDGSFLRKFRVAQNPWDSRPFPLLDRELTEFETP